MSPAPCYVGSNDFLTVLRLSHFKRLLKAVKFERIGTVFSNERLYKFGCRAVFVRFSLGGSEFRLATSDYSGHGGCQIGTVE